MANSNKLIFTEDQLIAYHEVYGIHEITRGGYVIGNSHEQGGIKCIVETENKGMFEVCAEIEGDEYVMNAMATIKYKDRLDEINSFYTLVPSIDYEHLNKLNSVVAVGDAGMLWLSKWPQYIINKYATAKYIEELDNMNKDALDEYLKQENIK